MFDITKRKFSNKGIPSRQDAKHAKFGGKVNYLGTIIDRYSPTFAAVASLREIFEFQLRLCRVRIFVVVIHRIKYQQRETLH